MATAAANEESEEYPIRIGISRCLLGDEVRYDGGHKRDSFLVDGLGAYVEWVPVCPELEAGFGVPRESMHLARIDGEVRLVTNRSGTDHTDAMSRYTNRRVGDLGKSRLSGFVLKKNSPSCGMERVKIYGTSGPVAKGRGMFAGALLDRYPHLPVEEEGRLNDPPLRENFIERVFAYHRLQRFFDGRWTLGGLVAFHTAQKLQLMSHSPRAYSTLGRLVATAKGADRQELRREYESQFMTALTTRATPKRHVNALQHAFGYFSDRIDSAERQEVLELIEDYGRRLVPLVVPITMIRHYVRKFDLTYLQGQTYLEPHPRELMLRNHV